MKKITIFMPTFLNGGVEKLLLTIAESLEDLYEIEFLFPGKLDEKFKSQLEKYQIKEFEITRSYGEGKVILSLPRLIKFLKKTDSSILFAAPGYSTIIAILGKILSRSKTKIIIVIDIKISTFSKSEKFYQQILPFFAKLLYKKSDMVVVSYKKVEEELILNYKIDKNMIRTIYPPLLKNDVYDKAEEEVNDNFFTNPNTLISVGRLVKEKDLETLIMSFSILNKDYHHYQLAIIGSGPEKNNLEKLVKKLNLDHKIKFFGYQSNPFKYINKSKILIVSSQWEAFGFTIIEALSLGKQVVITDVESQGPQEIINFGEFGFIAKTNSPESLAGKIIEAIINPKNSSKLIERSKLFFFENEKKRYINLIKDIIKIENE